MTKLLNALLYQLGWFACVGAAALGAGHWGAAAAIALTALHVQLSIDRRSELQLIAAAGLLGLVLETAQLGLGVLEFKGHPPDAVLPPLWILALWLQFATLFRYGLSWLSGRFGLAAVLGFLGGPLAFLGGERLGAATLAEPRIQSLLILGAVWAFALPVLLRLSDRRSSPGHYRWTLGPEST